MLMHAPLCLTWAPSPPPAPPPASLLCNSPAVQSCSVPSPLWVWRSSCPPPWCCSTSSSGSTSCPVSAQCAEPCLAPLTAPPQLAAVKSAVMGRGAFPHGPSPSCRLWLAKHLNWWTNDLAPRPTPARTARAGARTPHDLALECPPRNRRTGWDIGCTVMPVCTVSLAYAVVAPIILPFALVFFLLMWAVWRYQSL